MPGLDDAPRWLRVIPGILGVVLLLKVFGFKPNISIHLQSIPLILLLVGVGGVGSILVLRIKGNRRRVEPIEVCRSYLVKAKDPESASGIIDVVKERAKRGYAEYVLLSLFNEDGSGYSVLLLCGRRDLVDHETDIFETIIASLVKGSRLEGVREVDASPILSLLDSTKPSKDSLFLTALVHQARGNGANREGIYLGDTLETPLPEPVYLTDLDIEGHIGVYGSTGSGKSTTIRSIAYQAANLGFNVIIIDWTGEHSIHDPLNTLRAARGEFPVPLLELASNREGRAMLVDLLASSLGLTDPQAYLLSKILESPISSIAELLARLDSWPEESGWDREVKRGLRRKLAVLAGVEGAFRGKFNINHQLIVVDASSIRSPRARKVYVLSLLSYIYFYIRGSDHRVLVAVDEAHNLFQGESSLFEELLSESRKFGLHIAYATQAPSLVPDRVFLNTNTKIVHALRSQRDKQAIQAAMGLDDHKFHLLDKLVHGEALLQSPSIPQPILVKVKPVSPRSDIIGK